MRSHQRSAHDRGPRRVGADALQAKQIAAAGGGEPLALPPLDHQRRGRRDVAGRRGAVEPQLFVGALGLTGSAKISASGDGAGGTAGLLASWSIVPGQVCVVTEFSRVWLDLFLATQLGI